MRRRAFLVGGAAVVVAGAVGVEAYGPDKALHRLGLRSSPDHRVPPSGWTVEEGRFGDRTRWALSRPPEGEIDGAIVCLHGRNEDHRFAFDAVHVHDVVAHEGLALAVATVDGGAGSYWHARADGTDAGQLVVDQLVPLVVDQCRTDRIAIMGWSMGGYGALLAAKQHPGTFRAVVASSPALFGSFEEATPGAFDSAEDFAAHDLYAPTGMLQPPTRVDCGRGDPFIAQARRYADWADDAVSSFGRGYHDAAYWRSQAPEQVRFMARSLT